MELTAFFFSDPIASFLCPAQNSSDEDDVISLIAGIPHSNHLGNFGCNYFPAALFVQEHTDNPYYESHTIGTKFWTGFLLISQIVSLWKHDHFICYCSPTLTSSCLCTLNLKLFYQWNYTINSLNSFLFPPLTCRF